MSRLERVALFAALGLLAWLLWRSRRAAEALYQVLAGPGGPGGAGAPGGAAGAGAPGGLAPGGPWPGLEAVAEAIRILAAGVEAPALYGAFASFSGADLVEAVPAEGSSRIFVAAYAITVDADCTVTIWSGRRTSRLWQLRLAPAASTRSGANLSGSWPLSLLPPTNPGEGLFVETSAAAEVALAYWRR